MQSADIQVKEQSEAVSRDNFEVIRKEYLQEAYFQVIERFSRFTNAPYNISLPDTEANKQKLREVSRLATPADFINRLKVNGEDWKRVRGDAFKYKEGDPNGFVCFDAKDAGKPVYIDGNSYPKDEDPKRRIGRFYLQVDPLKALDAMAALADACIDENVVGNIQIGLFDAGIDLKFKENQVIVYVPGIDTKEGKDIATKLIKSYRKAKKAVPDAFAIPTDNLSAVLRGMFYGFRYPIDFNFGFIETIGNMSFDAHDAENIRKALRLEGVESIQTLVRALRSNDTGIVFPKQIEFDGRKALRRLADGVGVYSIRQLRHPGLIDPKRHEIKRGSPTAFRISASPA